MDYELTITPNYISNWSLHDAFRELIQNGIDREAVDPKCKFYIYYNKDKQVVEFTNRYSCLEVESLLLGNSSKNEDVRTVGQFGEGYKIATLVFLRLGKTFEIINSKKRELWVASIGESLKWHTEVLGFNISPLDGGREHIYEYGYNTLAFEIGNITPDEFSEISEIWLDFNGRKYGKITTTYGEILTDIEEPGNIYVNGLFVEYDRHLRYGYNFKPEYIKLERDRKSCSWWDKYNATSMMICEAIVNGNILLKDVSGLLESKIPDIENLVYHMNTANAQIVKDMLIKQFYKQYPDCIPVATQAEFNTVENLGGKAVILPEPIGQMLQTETKRQIANLSRASFSKSETLKQKFEKWLNAYFSYLPGEAIDEIRHLIERVNN